MRRLGLLLSLLVAVVGLAPATASAADGYCTGSGVNVVVDFGKVDGGGGVVKACGHGSNAGAAIRSAGFDLGYNAHMGGGFVCTVDGKPADGQCGAVDAYWGLFIAKAGGSWVYASLGADAQPVSDGQTVSFAWQSSKSRRSPGVAPAGPVSSKPTAAPTSKATHKAGKHEQKSAQKATTASTPTSAPSAAASATPTVGASATASATPKNKERKRNAGAAGAPSASPSDASAYSSTLKVSADKTDSGGGGLPWWLPVGVVVVLAGGGGAVAWRRTRGVKGS